MFWFSAFFANTTFYFEMQSLNLIVSFEVSLQAINDFFLNPSAV